MKCGYIPRPLGRKETLSGKKSMIQCREKGEV